MKWRYVRLLKGGSRRLKLKLNKTSIKNAVRANAVKFDRR
jgi:hypothetical protein